MSKEISDFDKWQVFEVSYGEVTGRTQGWQNVVKDIAQEAGIPIEIRNDHDNRRYLLATPTAKHFDVLMDKVDTEYQRVFDNRMAQLKSRYAKSAAPNDQPQSTPDSKPQISGDRMAQLRNRHQAAPLLDNDQNEGGQGFHL